MAIAQVDVVGSYTDAIRKLLEAARRIKPLQTIEPPLTYAGLAGDIAAVLSGIDGAAPKIENTQYAAVETAFRNIFYGLIASTSIDDPSFSEVWNLLDIVLIFSDQEWCEPALVFWLAEETLESQTIDGCHKVFDYLDARRERMITKHWKSKYLVVLRACTDLLRRLSRAEDTVFCGRVFIYLFQSFPLGDKSAVNLRGEYHVENVTVYDTTPTAPPPAAASPGAMDVDQQPSVPADSNERTKALEEPAPPPTITTTSDITVPDDKKSTEKDNAKSGDAPPATKILSTDNLYPIFWSLQEFFVKPTTLFDPSHLKAFQAGLEATLAKFKEIQKEQDARGGGVNNGKTSDEARAGAKRKRDDIEDASAASSYNPKYLTSRDLFELEIRDLAFRRHVLVQALILTEFLLAQTPKARARLQNVKNKSVIYDFTLDEPEIEWATKTRADIASYLQQGTEGKFYYRMVDTVLARDKNWVHWKAANCPPFQRAAVAPADFATVKADAQRATAPRRLRPAPMGALDLGFLRDHDGANGLAQLRDPQRSQMPALDSFERPIADDEFEAEMAKDATGKTKFQEARFSKMWRALRVAAKSRLNAFEALDDGANVSALFATPLEGNGEDTADDTQGAETAAGENGMQEVVMDAEKETHENENGDGQSADADVAVEPTIPKEVAVK